MSDKKTIPGEFMEDEAKPGVTLAASDYIIWLEKKLKDARSDGLGERMEALYHNKDFHGIGRVWSGKKVKLYISVTNCSKGIRSTFDSLLDAIAASEVALEKR